MRPQWLLQKLRQTRFYATATPPPNPQSHLTTILNRLPARLQPYTSRLRSAPVSHTIAFLILHEITAIVPLVGLASLFHWGGFLPEGYTNPEFIDKFGRYFARKGWFGFGQEGGAGEEAVEHLDENTAGGDHRRGAETGIGKRGIGSRTTEIKENRGGGGGGIGTEKEGASEGEFVGKVEDKWGVGEGPSRILIEVATAYAVTKVLLPVRVVASVWATPWFARVVVGRVGGWFGKRV